MDCTWFSSSAVVRKTWRPQVTGEECPRPGTSVCQAMFSVGLHVGGTFCGAAMPLPLGPRHQGQSLGETWIGGSCSYWAALPAISSMPGAHVANSTKQDAKNDGTLVIDRVLGD